jgi:purine-nucleoside phosphorylase
METSALFASARALGVEAAALLVIADELSAGWRAPADMRAIEATLQRVAGAALRCLTA